MTTEQRHAMYYKARDKGLFREYSGDRRLWGSNIDLRVAAIFPARFLEYEKRGWTEVD